jgi:2,4-dienoyl-CoA reductase-like NADH-dependent reductase (Old Yellow Enzyme family)
MEVKNRFMRSATTSYYAFEDGTVRDSAIELYENLAKGGIGLIVKGHLYISESGKAHQGMAGISSDIHISRLKELTDIVHNNESKIVAQINHGGYRSSPDRVGPSKYETSDWAARSLSEDEIDEVIESFGDAAERAMQAGFDGVQIHGAHGYLISQFLSNHVNKRDDKWGGGLENRMRLLMEVYQEVRKRVGDYPVMLKINCDDFYPESFTIDESVEVSKTICEKGLDLIEVSGGGFERKPGLKTLAKHSDSKLSEPDYAGYASLIRDVTRPTPLALVSGFETLTAVQTILSKGIADMVSLSRPFIREPNLVNEFKSGQDAVSCIRCNACIGDDVFGKTMLQCQVD